MSKGFFPFSIIYTPFPPFPRLHSSELQSFDRMDEISGCICHFLSTLIDNVNQALGSADRFTTPNDLGPSSSMLGAGEGPAALAAGDSFSDSLTSSHVAAFVVLILVVLSFLQGSSSGGSTNTKPGRTGERGGGGSDPSGSGPGPSVS